jgi:hypothetical protein
MAVGTLHNLFHEVETATDCEFRSSFITQIYAPNVALRQALVNSPNATLVDDTQKCADVLSGLIPMTQNEVDIAMQKPNKRGKIALPSPEYMKMGGLTAMKAALALPINRGM